MYISLIKMFKKLLKMINRRAATGGKAEKAASKWNVAAATALEQEQQG